MRPSKVLLALALLICAAISSLTIFPASVMAQEVCGNGIDDDMEETQAASERFLFSYVRHNVLGQPYESFVLGSTRHYTCRWSGDPSFGRLSGESFEEFLGLLDDHLFFSLSCVSNQCETGTTSEGLYLISYTSNSTEIEYEIDQGYMELYEGKCASLFMEALIDYNFALCSNLSEERSR